MNKLVDVDKLEKDIKKLPRFSFLSPKEGGVRRCLDKSGAWIERHEVIQIIETMLEASPQVEVEPVTYLVFHSYDNGLDRDEGFTECDKLTDGAFPVYTSPPDTEAKLKLAVEALSNLVEMCITHVGENYDDHIHKCYIQGKQALEALKGK